MREIRYHLAGEALRAVWPSEVLDPPERAAPAGDGTTADAALRRIRAGEWLLYRGDYHNARQLLAALGRRLRRAGPRGGDPASAYRALRRQRREEQQVLSRLLVPFEAGGAIPLRRAPDAREAMREAWGELPAAPGLVPLRELLGVIGAGEWRRKGVPVRALDGRVHPHYGVFAPVRAEHVDLVAAALEGRDLAGSLAFDVGTGTGVLALLLARRGARVVATDREPRAVACARENAARFGLAGRIEVAEADLFPAGQADLVVCNPPWLPDQPHGLLDRAVYDPGSAMLLGFLAGLPAHLRPSGEGWLVLSDLAEIVGLRPAGFLSGAFARSSLAVAWTRTARPTHRRAADADDPLHAARSRETTTLYCLRASG
jgi:methylase of polypeptide subunit release factors